jgi:hypothetical protein
VGNDENATEGVNTFDKLDGGVSPTSSLLTCPQWRWEMEMASLKRSPLQLKTDSIFGI